MLLGFKKRFVEPILIGTKVHTLRKPRKNEPKIGERLFMYTALRTKQCELITDKETLMGKQKAVVSIERYASKNNAGQNIYTLKVNVDGRALKFNELQAFIGFDGFKSLADFCEFWFVGVKENKIVEEMDLFHWTDLKY